jgi:hypothetical protein
MTNKRPATPTMHVREYAHELAEKLAREQLAGIADFEGQCRRSGARYLPEKAAVISYLGCSYRLGADGLVAAMSGDGEVPRRDRILILHYFTRAKGTPISNRPITYQELPDGLNYFPVFAKRAIRPIVSHFGGQPEKLVETARVLGGRRADYGDMAITIDAFPRVPVTIALWRGDAEFAPEGSILFDGTIADYLANDDIHALCENMAWQLVRLLKSGG